MKFSIVAALVVLLAVAHGESDFHHLKNESYFVTLF